MPERRSTPKLTFREVDAKHWRDLERLFESRGGPKSCWCMLWRANADESRRGMGRAEKRRWLRASAREHRFACWGTWAPSRSHGARSRHDPRTASSSVTTRTTKECGQSCASSFRASCARLGSRSSCSLPPSGTRAGAVRNARGLSGRRGFAELSVHGLRLHVRAGWFSGGGSRRHAPARHASRVAKVPKMTPDAVAFHRDWRYVERR